MTGPLFTPGELAAATGGRWTGAAPDLAGVSTDTRTVAAGNLFVALRGERFDAHDFIADAARAGAAAAVVSEAWLAGRSTPFAPSPSTSPPAAATLRTGSAPTPAGAESRDAPLPLLAVPDTLAALGAIARHHRRRFRIPVVGVTGSNGKTTTREMIAAVLSVRGKVLRTEGNLNNEVGVPLTLLGLDETHQAAVIEMGMSHPGEIARIAAIAEPWIGVVTNAAAAHLEGLGSIEGVADAKAELYRGVHPGGLVVANADDPRMLRRAQESGRRLLTFAVGRGRRGDVVVLEIRSQTVEGLRFVLGIGNREVEVAIPLVGAHNAANAAAAACVAVAMGSTDREIVQGLAAARPPGRRLRLERLPSGVQLVDDCYNANPLSMAAALRTLADLAGAPGSRAVAVLGDMLELGAFEAEAHRNLGAEAAGAGVKLLAAFGPRSRATAEAGRAAGIPEVFHTEDVGALAAFVRERLRPTDVLLVKGSRGMKLERLVEALR